MIKILAQTSDDINGASSRLRSFYFFYHAENYGLDIRRKLSLPNILACEMLHLQKCYSPKYLLLSLFYRICGKRVVFDIDDQVEKPSHYFALIFMLKVASHVTTDTVKRLEYLTELSINKSKFFVVPDVLDFAPNVALSKTAPVKRIPTYKGILWFGHRGNLISIKELLDSSEEHLEFPITIATKIYDQDSLILQYKSINFIPWSIDITFNPTLPVRYCLLNHILDESSSALYKSENKMVTAILSGLVPIVSNSPAYAELARQLGAEQLVFQKMDDVFKIIKSLDDKWIEDFLIRANLFVINRYSSNKILKDFVKTIV